MTDEPSAPTSPSPSPFDPQWPGTPDAQWPAACSVWDVGRHPKLPWITLACNKDDFGAIMVIDAQSGALVSVSTSDETTGWANEGLVLWDRTGTRLCTNADTGGIAVLEGAAFVGLNHPARGRDGATHYAWVDHRIYADTNTLFDPKHTAGWARFEFPKSRELLWTTDGFRWNENINAVVGRTDPTEDVVNENRRLIAYDPVRDTVLYDRAAGDVMPLRWSLDGRWILTAQRPSAGGSADVILIDGDDGKETHRLQPKHGTAGRMSVSNDGDVVASSSRRPAPTEEMLHATELWRHGKPPVELPVVDGVAIAWAPDASGLAWLDARGTVTIIDVTTARPVTTFSAPEPAVPGTGSKPFAGHTELLWVSPSRIAVVGAHYASIYALDGTRIAQFTAPS